MKTLFRTIGCLGAICAAAALLPLAGCKSAGNSAGTPSEASLPNFSLNTAWEELTAGYTPWSDVEIPVKASLESPSGMTLSGKATMSRGQAVSVSLRKIGIEVASLYMDADSVLLVSKPLRIAYRESIAAFREAAGVTIADMQSAMLGRIFAPGSNAAGAPAKSAFSLAVGSVEAGRGIEWTATPRKRGNSIIVFHAVTNTDLQAPSVLSALTVQAGPGVEVEYGEPAYTEAGPMASSATVRTTLRSRQVQGRLQWTPEKAKWNSGATPSRPRIPSGYRVLSTAELLNIVKGL